MDFILWLVVIALFILSFIGIIYPIIPAPVVLWGGFLVYHFFIDSGELTWVFWTSMIILTAILIIADVIANSYFVKRFGGSKKGEWVAAIAVIFGSFIIPPFGILVLPFVAVFITELLQKRTLYDAGRASIGSLLGFLSGSVAKFIITLVMVIWFLVVVIF
ncbi:DUF456 domain-containing protein [Halalkalibacillus sediminis]|uniref:DUF456 domain-containing protein n=1 Tax=Halalkalibacillus sediminis TaxID=2018042 RepID=A0A2I0QS44_9BACI|nr:DUF456 domain-containing protein [Halalkalibacillus sediminis]PKR77156.1 DUF456 domain-containing protein [Halalkalibacillus sediminis]